LHQIHFIAEPGIRCEFHTGTADKHLRADLKWNAVAVVGEPGGHRVFAVEDFVLGHNGHDLNSSESAGFGFNDILALVDDVQAVKRILKKSLDHEGVAGFGLRQVQGTKVKETADHVPHISGRVEVLGLLQLARLVIEHLHFDLLVYMIEVGPLVFFIPSFPYAANKLVRHECGRIDIGTPVVVHVGHPIHYAYRPAPDIHLVAGAVVHFVIVGMDLRRTLAHSEYAIRHLKLEDFTPGKAVVWYTLIGVVSGGLKSRRRYEQYNTG